MEQISLLRWRTKHNCDYRLICNTDIIIDDGRKRYERVNVRQQSGCQRVI